MTPKERSDLYIQRATNERMQVMRSRFELDQSYDKYLLTFSTGTLYLSVLFFNDLVREGICISLLILGWFSLVVSMGTALSSLYYSRKAYSALEDHLDDDITKELTAQQEGTSLLVNQKWNNPYNDCVDQFEKMATVTFALGVILILTFYILNVVT